MPVVRHMRIIMVKGIRVIIFLILVFLYLGGSYANQDPSSKPSYFDTSVNGIVLDDAKSCVVVLGAERLEKIFEYFRGLCIPDFRYGFFNDKKTQVLEVIFHAGGYTNEFSEFRVYTAKGSRHEVFETLEGHATFTTGQGITLGMPMDDVISILGNNYQKRRLGEMLILSYPFLPVEASLYYYECIFYHGKLIEFSFGYEYP